MSRSSLGSQSSLSEARRSKLLQIKEREDLKGSLVSKYTAKYGKSTASVAKEVDKFLNSNALTEENLRKLDNQIEQMSSVSGMSVISGDSALPRLKPRMTSARSVSYMSGASKLSNSYKATDDLLSVGGKSSKSSVVEVPQGKDEWAAILKYKSIIFEEEEKQRQLRLQEQKQAMRRELDRQIGEKEQRRAAEREELAAYLANEARNKQLADDKEAQENEQNRLKALKEKQTRHQQITEKRRKVRAEKKLEKQRDLEYIRQMKLAHAQELKALNDKRQQEATRMEQMLADNEVWRKQREQEEQQAKRDEVRLQQQYTAMIDKHDNDRLALLRERDLKQKQLMDKMSDTVLKDQMATSKAEDQELLRYYQAKNKLERDDDSASREQEIMRRRYIRAQLEQQIKEKEDRERQEKEQSLQQAEMWRHDSQAFFQQEASNRQRKKQLYDTHAQELRNQIQLKASQGGGMTTIERAYNKQVLKEVVKSNSN